MINYQTITIDLQPDYREPVVQMYLSERDVGRPIQVNVLMQGQPYSFTAGTTVHIDLRKPSGHVVQVNGNYAVGSNVVLFNVVEQMAAEPGMCLTELSIVGDGQDPIGSKNWLTKVELSPLHAGDPSETWIEDLDELVQDAMEGHIDATLSIPGDAADAAAVGEEIADLQSAISQIKPGLSDRSKTALLNCFAHVAWIDDQGQTYYDELEDALNAVDVLSITLDTYSLAFTSIGNTHQLTATTIPSGGEITWFTSNSSVATVSDDGLVTTVGYGSANISAVSGTVSSTCAVLVSEILVTSIDAVYTQSGAVYETDLLNSLKSDLVVTAHWSDSSQTVVPSADYSLSGTLTTGTSVITVSYGGQTADFNVTVTAVVLDHISAVFSPGSAAIYEGDALDTLKQYLLVTAYYNNGTSEVVTDYTLSGTLVEGTNTITVSYMNETTTFTVVAISHVLYKLENRSFNGTDEYVDTQLALFDTDRSFTILIDITENFDYSSLTTSKYCTVFGLPNRDGIEGVVLNIARPSGTSQNVNHELWMFNRTGHVVWRTPVGESGHSHIRFAISRNAGETPFNYAASNNGAEIVTFIENVRNATYQQYTDPISVGARLNVTTDLMTNFWAGTVHQFTVLDYAMSQTECNQFVLNG